jgi:D-alanyl-lipoteichoic acid acyltransferase DltB (MBOAT superfamily)
LPSSFWPTGRCEKSLHIILPVGISFFTFQSMSYSFDIYRGRLTAIRNFVDFSLYVAFFPQLVAGPIVRARDFLPQLSVPRQLAAVPFKAAIALFLIGFLKKACIADNLAPITEQVFGATEPAATNGAIPRPGGSRPVRRRFLGGEPDDRCDPLEVVPGLDPT